MEPHLHPALLPDYFGAVCMLNTTMVGQPFFGAFGVDLLGAAVHCRLVSVVHLLLSTCCVALLMVHVSARAAASEQGGLSDAESDAGVELSVSVVSWRSADCTGWVGNRAQLTTGRWCHEPWILQFPLHLLSTHCRGLRRAGRVFAWAPCATGCVAMLVQAWHASFSALPAVCLSHGLERECSCRGAASQ